VKRREFMLLPGVAMTARSLRAQQKAMPVIGFLSIVSPGPSYEPLFAALRQGLTMPAMSRARTWRLNTAGQRATRPAARIGR
jgi:hypothetical protein